MEESQSDEIIMTEITIQHVSTSKLSGTSFIDRNYLTLTSLAGDTVQSSMVYGGSNGTKGKITNGTLGGTPNGYVAVKLSSISYHKTTCLLHCKSAMWSIIYCIPSRLEYWLILFVSNIHLSVTTQRIILSLASMGNDTRSDPG